MAQATALNSDNITVLNPEYTILQRRCFYPMEGINRYIIEVERNGKHFITEIVDTATQRDQVVNSMHKDIDQFIFKALHNPVYNLKCASFVKWMNDKNLEVIR